MWFSAFKVPSRAAWILVGLEEIPATVAEVLYQLQLLIHVPDTQNHEASLK